MNYQQIEHKLATMTERSKLYKLVKNELEKRGHWKPAPRGKAFNRGSDIRRNNLKGNSAPASTHIEDTTNWGA